MRLLGTCVVLVLGAFPAVAGDDSRSAATVADSLRSLGMERFRHGDYESADSLLTEALRIRTDHHGPDDESIAWILYNQASLAKARGRYDESRELNGRADEIFRRIEGERGQGVALALNQRANLESDLGNYEESLPYYEEALSVFQEALGPAHEYTTSVLGNLADLLRVVGRYGEALAIYETAIESLEAAGDVDPLYLATFHENRATVLMDTGEYEEARRLIERTLALRRQSLGPDHHLVGFSLNNLANLSIHEGDLEEAVALHREALAIKERADPSRSWDLAITLNNLGALLDRGGSPEEAVELLERAAAIRRDVYGPDHPALASTLRNLSLAYLHLGNSARARELAEESLRAAERISPSHASCATALHTLTRVALVEGDAGRARELAGRALAIDVAAFGEWHPRVAEDRVILAQALRASGDDPAAIEEALRAEKIAREHVRVTVRGLSERQALAYAAARPDGLGLALSWLEAGADAPTVAAVWDAIVRRRGIVLREIVARKRALRQGAEGAGEHVDRWNEVNARLASLVVRGAPDDDAEAYGRLLAELRAEKEEVERRLAVESAGGRAEADAGGLATVIGALGVDDALVTFARTPATEEKGARYLAFVVRGGERPGVVDLGSADELDFYVSLWRTEIESGDREADCAKAGVSLRERMLDPLGAPLAGAKRWLLVPEGELQRVNVLALPDPVGDYYAESDVAIRVLTDEREVVSAKEPESGQGEGGAFVVGAPAYDAPPDAGSKGMAETFAGAAGGTGKRVRLSSCPDFRELSFAPLPGAEAEGRVVFDRWTGARGRTAGAVLAVGRDATEGAFKRESPGRSVLHLATHGYFLGATCTPTRGGDVPLGVRWRRPDDYAVPVALENPLLLSGLALASANRRHGASAEAEDGVLTAEEITSLDLSGVGLTVLSACESGEGVVRTGEGLFGLTRAFRMAGVEQLVVSLWRVGDESARAWMDEFYAARLEQGVEVGEAVRQASRRRLEAEREKGEAHPSRWAAFVALGSGR